MNKMNHVALVAITALLLGTGVATALDPIGGLNSEISPSPQDSINDAVMPSTEDHINRAVLTDPEGGINDAVLAGARGRLGRGHNTLLALVCSVGGNELIVLANKGDAVPAGTKLKWEIASADEAGYVRLKSELGTGETVKVDFGGGVDAGTPCAAKAI